MALGIENNPYPSLDALVNAFAEKRMKSARPSEETDIRLGLKYSCRPAPHIGDLQKGPYYRMLHNSELRGKWYFDNEGKKQVVPENCAASSLDRRANVLTTARVMKLDGTDVCYAGRPDTLEKFQELVAMMIKSRYPEPASRPDTFKFAIHSFVATFSRQDICLPGEGIEYELLQKEIDMLKKIKPEITIDGKTIKLEWTIFCRNIDGMNILEKTLPPAFSGKGRSRLLSDDVEGLKKFLPSNRSLFIKNALQSLANPNLKAEEELFLRLLICKEANIPIVLHCRSCINRTTIGAALVYALHKVNVNEKNPLATLDDPEFKKHVWEHLKFAHAITPYPGGKDGYKLEQKSLKWFTQYPALHRLLPSEMLQEFNFFKLKPEQQALFLSSPICMKRGKLKVNPYPLIAPFFIFKSGLGAITSFCYSPEASKLPKLLAILLSGALSLCIMKTLFDLGLLFGIYTHLAKTLSKKETHWKEPLHLARAVAVTPFLAIPEKIIPPGTEGSEGNPLIFGDKVAKPKGNV